MPQATDRPASVTSGPLERGLQVIEALTAARVPLRPADLMRATGLVRSTVDRVISTLVQIGYLRWQGREVTPAPRLMELGNAYLAGTGLCDALGPHAVRLADELDESVSLAVPDLDGVRFISQSPRRRSMSVAFGVGDLLPAERCAPGALFASGWDEADWARWREGRARRRFSIPPAVSEEAAVAFEKRAATARDTGWAVDDQLIEPGLVAVAVPVRGPSGDVVCALSVVSHTSRHSADSLRAAASPLVEECVRRMEGELARGRPGRPADLAHGVDRSREAKQELGPEFLQTLDRGLAVLVALGSVPGGLTLSEAAALTGLPRASARRALLTLGALGYVGESGRRFLPLPRVLDLGYTVPAGLSFEDLVRPHLRDLVARVHDSASVAVLDGTEIRYVARAATVRLMRVTISIGTRFPAHATSMGRVLLAGLTDEQAAARLAEAGPLPALTPHTRTGPEELLSLVAAARRDGHALVDQELEEGLRSVSVPVRDRAGRVVAAVNTACHSGDEPPERTLQRVLPALEAAAAAIEADLAVHSRYHDLPLT